jgi:rhodanese-related sulfurtransferase
MDDQLRYYEAKLQYEIDPWDLNEALGRGDKIHLVDTRSPEAYGRSHIPGAVNIPHRTMSHATTDHLEQRGFDRHVLRWDSVQRLDQRCTEHGAAWVPGKGVDRRSRLLAVRRLSG